MIFYECPQKLDKRKKHLSISIMFIGVMLLLACASIFGALHGILNFITIVAMGAIYLYFEFKLDDEVRDEVYNAYMTFIINADVLLIIFVIIAILRDVF